ncbi:MAG: NAD(+) synthase, partial [Oscillospiraceae bacterium]|nr:NAD(+) synthase [Oscillospiraceae bacterium]
MKNGFVKIACCTPEIRVADCEFNKTKIIGQLDSSVNDGAKIIVFPELCVTGATCGDLFMRETLIKGSEKALVEICEKTINSDAVVIVGAPLLADDGKLYNCAVVIQNGEFICAVPKTNLSLRNLRVFSAFDGEQLWAFIGEIPVEMEQAVITCENMTELSLGIVIS